MPPRDIVVPAPRSAPVPSDAVARRFGAGPAPVWGLVALAAALYLVVRAFEMTPHTGVRLLVALLLVQLPASVGVWVLVARRRSREKHALDTLADLGKRMQQAEEALAREHNRLHQLRATIAGVSLAHRLLSDPPGQLPAAERAHLQRLHDSELGRVERLLSDDRPRRIEVVDVGQVIDPLAGMLQLRGHPVAWSGTRVRVWGWRDDVAEIVHVLLENAVRHGGGREIHVEASRTGDKVEVRVSDRGPGVAPGLRDMLFERGTRVAQSPGQGIGLHVAARLARQMGGELRHETSQRGHGATFVLTLRAVETRPGRR